MKNTIFLILLLAASVSAQTLPETLNFLNDKMADRATFQMTKGTVVNVEPVNFSGCTVSWIESYTLTGEQAPVTTLKVSVPLRTVLTSFTGTKVSFLGEVSVQRITRENNPAEIAKSKTYFIEIADKTSAEKISRAFNHANELCKAQPEPF